MTSKKLSREGLSTAEAVLSLGLVVAKELLEHGIATVFLNSDGEVEVCPPGEYPLDALPQEEALATLLDGNYSDEQMIAYLKGRNARARLNNG